MRLVRFSRRGQGPVVGLVEDEEVVDLSPVLGAEIHTVESLLEGGQELLARAREATNGRGPRCALEEVELHAPIARPGKFLAIGFNYADHIEETGRDAPEDPVFFNKQSTCVSGPFDPIERPRASEALDYEGELGFVIGTRCRHVPAERATEVIAGYLVVDDVSVRDWQRATPTITLGKSWDTHGPIGPWLTTADELDDPHDLRIQTWVNGEQRQDSRTSNLVFDCFAQVAHLSTVCTLEPGDIVATGTPAGIGVAMEPRRFLVPGDVVRIEVEGLGAIENPVIDEPDDAPRIDRQPSADDLAAHTMAFPTRPCPS